MADIKATIRQTSALKGSATSDKEIVAQSLRLSAGSLNLGDLADVNTSGQTEGGMMIFDSTTGKYIITPTIENQNTTVNSGTY